jgi:hypothetical protein
MAHGPLSATVLEKAAPGSRQAALRHVRRKTASSPLGEEKERRGNPLAFFFLSLYMRCRDSWFVVHSQSICAASNGEEHVPSTFNP